MKNTAGCTCTCNMYMCNSADYAVCMFRYGNRLYGSLSDQLCGGLRGVAVQTSMPVRQYRQLPPPPPPPPPPANATLLRTGGVTPPPPAKVLTVVRWYVRRKAVLCPRARPTPRSRKIVFRLPFVLRFGFASAPSQVSRPLPLSKLRAETWPQVRRGISAAPARAPLASSPQRDAPPRPVRSAKPSA